MNEGVKQLYRPDGKNAIHDGIEHEPGGGKALLDPTDTVFLLLDHQTGLFQNVKDIAVAQLRANVVALAKLATLQDIPVITTASVRCPRRDRASRCSMVGGDSRSDERHAARSDTSTPTARRR